MLQKHPDGQPQSAQDVADALGAGLASGGGQQAGPRGDGQRRSLPRRAVGGSDDDSSDGEEGEAARRALLERRGRPGWSWPREQERRRRESLRWLHALKVRDDPRHMERRLYGDCHVRDNVLAVVLIYIIVN